MRLDEDKKESTVQRPGSYPASACERIVRTQRLTIYCLLGYRLGDLSVEPEEPDDLPDVPPPVAPDEPDEPAAPDEPRDSLAPDQLEDLLLTPNAWAVFSSTVPVMVKPSDF